MARRHHVPQTCGAGRLPAAVDDELTCPPAAEAGLANGWLHGRTIPTRNARRASTHCVGSRRASERPEPRGYVPRGGPIPALALHWNDNKDHTADPQQARNHDASRHHRARFRPHVSSLRCAPPRRFQVRVLRCACSRPFAAQHTLYPVQRPPSHVGDPTPPCCPACPFHRQRSVQVRAERRDERSGLPEPPPTADDFLAEGTRPRNFWEVMTFTGWVGGALCNSGTSAGCTQSSDGSSGSACMLHRTGQVAGC